MDQSNDKIHVVYHVSTMTSEYTSFIVSGVMVLGLIVAALQLAGVINLNVARILLCASWLVAVGLAAASLEIAALRHRMIAGAIVGIPFGIGLILLERWITAKRSQAKTIIQSEPNIVCLGEDDLSVFLDKHEVFRETDFENSRALRSTSVKFTNEPRLGKKVASIDNVRAEIIYYQTDWPTKEEYRVHYGCWLNEESPYVSFNLTDKAIQQLIVGAFEEKREGGFERRFTIYGNNPDRNVELTKNEYGECRGFRIKVRIIAGEQGEFTSEHDFELEIDPGSSYSFVHLSEEKKLDRRDGAAYELVRRIQQGEKLMRGSQDQKFYSEAYEWRYGTENRIRHLFGTRVSERFHNAGSLASQGKDGRLADELKGKVEALKELLADFESAKLVLPFDL